jgi:thiamine kinase-like enzyme
MAILPASRKAKGRRLQDLTVDCLLATLSPDLKSDHIRGAIMGESGEDLPMTNDAREVLSGYEFECKALAEVKRADIYAAIRQAKERLKPNNRYCIVFKQDSEQPHASILLTEFATLLRNAHILRRLTPVLQTILRYTDQLDPNNEDVSFIQKELKRFVDDDLKAILTKRKSQ